MGNDLWNITGDLIRPYIQEGNAFLLTDVNVRKLCLPVLQANIKEIGKVPVFSIPAGEVSKSAIHLEKVWQWLMASGASRGSLLINLGGGVVTDIGGFAAATYNRGMKYINIPTTLMGQVDAGIGGKTGINIGGVKNQVGLFYDPLAVFIVPEFLETLPEEHTRSGFAEIIKCAALAGDGFWEKVKDFSLADKAGLFDLACETAHFKCAAVAADPYDNSSRNMLNFGHTVGHGLESHYISLERENYLHGDAIAAGMICEAWISHQTTGLSVSEMEEVTSLIIKYFHLSPIEVGHFEQICSIMEYDKKKTPGGVGFSLLNKLGKPVSGKTVERKILLRSLEYYNNAVSQ
jgi:3-dehydroquinate synthase